MLEDAREDVLQKALLASGLSKEEAACRSGLSLDEVARCLEGDRIDEDRLASLAVALGLCAMALIRLDEYQPGPLALDGVRQIVLPFGPHTVNAWLLEAGCGRVLVDSGVEADSLSEALCQELPDRVLITHGHRDHIGGLRWLVERGIPAYGWDIEGAEQVRPGGGWSGEISKLRGYNLSGHYSPSLGYGFSSFDVPVLAVGDSIFAGSMGRCSSPESFRQAVSNLRRMLKDKPDEAILLPGHGPPTTLGEERVANPFLAGKL